MGMAHAPTGETTMPSTHHAESSLHDVLDGLRERASEHETGSDEDRQYAAGIRDAISALLPFLPQVQR